MAQVDWDLPSAFAGSVMRLARLQHPLLVAIGLASMPVTTAADAGLNMQWGDCTLGSPSYNQIDACNNDGVSPHELFVTMDPGFQVIGNVVGAEGIVLAQIEGGAVPDYWRLGPIGCRNGALSVDATFAGDFSCPEAWSQATSHGASVSIQPLLNGPDRVYFTWSVAVSEPVSFDRDVAPDWYLVKLVFSGAGTTTCSGCSIPACLRATQVTLFRPAGDPAGDLLVNAPALSRNAAWQGGGTLFCTWTDVNDPGPDGQPVVAPNWTWGMIKSMYR